MTNHAVFYCTAYTSRWPLLQCESCRNYEVIYNDKSFQSVIHDIPACSPETLPRRAYVCQNPAGDVHTYTRPENLASPMASREAGPVDATDSPK